MGSSERANKQRVKSERSWRGWWLNAPDSRLQSGGRSCRDRIYREPWRGLLCLSPCLAHLDAISCTRTTVCTILEGYRARESLEQRSEVHSDITLDHRASAEQTPTEVGIVVV